MKKRMISIILVCIIFIVAISVFIIQNRYDNKDKIKSEESSIGNNYNNTSKGKNSLVVYFSLPETNKADNMTEEEENSTVVIDGEVLGNTQYIAQIIKEKTNADIYRIEAENDYPLNHDTLVNQAQKEQEDNARPKIKSKVNNFDDYDIVYLGYPIWWGDMPQILYTFLDSYDFKGKKIIPFSTHGGSGLAGTVDTLKNYLPDASVEENAFSLSRDDMDRALDEVDSWLKGIDVSN